MPDQAKYKVILTIPIYPNMELTAAQTASILAEIMSFEENHIDEIQFALIETCINAFEHSKSKDKQVIIKFIMSENELELKITDRGGGFRLDQVKSANTRGAMSEGIRKRGWGSRSSRV